MDISSFFLSYISTVFIRVFKNRRNSMICELVKEWNDELGYLVTQDKGVIRT